MALNHNLYVGSSYLSRYWCSTKVDEDGTHVKKNFGHCNKNCSPEPLCYTLLVKVVMDEIKVF